MIYGHACPVPPAPAAITHWLGRRFFLVRFHHITPPVTACATSIRLASDITVLLGMPKISPVWMARLAITSRAPAGPVRDPSANSTPPPYLSTITRPPPPCATSPGHP